MSERGQVEDINGEFQLPQPILHRVQYFLTAKEAAQTAILSKSWRSAWSTRPNLDLDLQDFRGDEYESRFDKFSKLATKTVQRYEQSNLKIESFSLCMIQRAADLDSKRLAKDLITRALKIGATHLSLQLSRTDVLPLVVFEAENLVGLSVSWCKILGFGRKVRCLKLESLSLCYVQINSVVFGDLSSRFPCLKDLTLQGCKTHVVSSRYLERLDFATGHFGPRSSVTFDVPSLRKFMFRFEGDDTPSLSFVSAPREWESDVIITGCDRNLSTLWFRRLNKFLTESSLSRISLSIKSFYHEKCLYEVGDIRGLPKPKLENLTINKICLKARRCFVLLHGLFQICRPKVITLDYEMSFVGETRRYDDLLCKTLERGLDDKCMYGLHDLEEVNVHLFDKDVGAWRTLPLESFLDSSISPKGIQKNSLPVEVENVV